MNLIIIDCGIETEIYFYDCNGEQEMEIHEIIIKEKGCSEEGYQITEKILIDSDMIENLELNLTNLVIKIRNYRKSLSKNKDITCCD